MNLGNLRAFLAQADVKALPDKTPCGVGGHFGEFHKFWDDMPKVETLRKSAASKSDTLECVTFPVVDIGPEPI